MNSNPQLEIHPGAESLNAFAEQALPAREREQIVAHLAVCGRCRQVIFLARQEVAAMGMAAAPAVQSARRSGNWLNGWRLAWIPAAALAGVAGLVFLVHGRHEETRTEMARATLPVAPQNQASIANLPVNNRVVGAVPHVPVSHALEKQPETQAESAPAGAAYAPAPAAAAPRRATASEAVTVTTAPPLLQSESASAGQVIDKDTIDATPLNGRNWVYVAQLTAGKDNSAAPSTPRPAMPGTPQPATGANSSSATVEGTAKAKMDEMEARSRASRKAEAGYGGLGGSSTSYMKKDALPGSSFDAGASMPSIRFEGAHEINAAPQPLPSGLTIISSATAQHRTVAIDQAGAVFLSSDSGSHWEAVVRQWSGRAANVISVLQTSGGSAAAGSSGGAMAAPVEVFELRNDKNQTWVSADGMIWTAQ